MLLFCGIMSFCLFGFVVNISDEHKEFILKAHNDLRRDIALGNTPNQPSAANMIEMVWDDDLAQKADEWAGKCIAGHDTYDDRALDKFMFVGQNMFAGPNFKEVVQGWYDEYKDYTFESKGCKAVCGHYTQVAWAKSFAVGCSSVNCKEKTGSFPYGWLFICNYGPAGNFNDEPPYAVGAACSQCPKGTSCKNSLCALDDPKAILEFDEERKKKGLVKRHGCHDHDDDEDVDEKRKALLKRHHHHHHDRKRHHHEHHDHDHHDHHEHDHHDHHEHQDDVERKKKEYVDHSYDDYDMFENDRKKKKIFLKRHEGHDHDDDADIYRKKKTFLKRHHHHHHHHHHEGEEHED